MAAPPFLGADAASEPLRLLSACPLYRPTPLLSLPGLARRLGIGALLVKDETERLGLGSFKALGGVFAVATLFAEEAARVLGPLAPADYVLERFKVATRGLTACCASDGNHGRSVAAGARLFGGSSVVYLPSAVTEKRAERIATFGARIVRVAGSYDEAVARAAADAAANGWLLVADTAPENDARACALVMQGYSVLVHEVLDALAGDDVTHVFLQAGVGGLAAAFMAHWTARRGAGPRFIVVEPEGAACCLASAQAGRPVRIATGDTVMAMLECGEPSPLAWPVLASHASAFMAVADGLARAAVRALARPEAGDPALAVGESGAAGLAGLMRAAHLAADLHLNADSRVVVIATECPSDRAIWERTLATSD